MRGVRDGGKDPDESPEDPVFIDYVGFGREALCNLVRRFLFTLYQVLEIGSLGFLGVVTKQSNDTMTSVFWSSVVLTDDGRL